jgi:hypothetical protein
MTMPANDSPGPVVVLQLAPLPRAQIGPFLLLGVDKDADREAIEAAWAERVKLARRGQAKVALEDVNWAREMLSSKESRLRADAVSLNVDTTDGTLRKLKQHFQRQDVAGCRPLDAEKWLAEHAPPTPVPTLESVRQSIPVPQLPLEVPLVRVLLEQLAREPIDPWQLDLDA